MLFLKYDDLYILFDAVKISAIFERLIKLF